MRIPATHSLTSSDTRRFGHVNRQLRGIHHLTRFCLDTHVLSGQHAHYLAQTR
jgi:hypothetical protein